ncbi:MAG: proton-conducting transporter membrane subunit [Bacteroidota bacterium]
MPVNLLYPLLGVAIALLVLPWFAPKLSGWISFLASVVVVVFSIVPSVMVLSGSDVITTPLYTAFGEYQLRLDALSAWFVIIINIISLAGSFYGQEYLGHYPDRRSDLKVHFALLPLFQASMVYVTLFNDLFLFIVVWEIMSLSSFLLILFERKKEGTVKAATNYFIQMHVSVVFLLIGTFYLYYLSGGTSFTDMAALPQQAGTTNSLLVFLLFFIGFGIKSGFIPFHTWLPHAHPAAPSHLSGIMSGVIIKVGIYGILRVVMQSPANMIVMGWIIMIFAVCSGLYGVMLAIIQHNLKKLLAYHSIENIGIIGIGLGMGVLGMGYGNTVLAFMGFAGALLHTLNHSLFKSLLFFSAGNVYQATGTVNIENLGGLGKKMPYTSAFFLIGAIAICGLPPLNGFVSEFIIYLGLFKAIHLFGLSESFSFALVIAALALISGLAILCFTKAFGIVFQGSARKPLAKEPVEMGWVKKVPMMLIVAMMVFIGFFPGMILRVMEQPLHLMVAAPDMQSTLSGFATTLSSISWISGVFIAIILVVAGLRKLAQRKTEISTSETWGCGYVAPNPRMQYTASSFARTFRKLFEPLVSVEKDKINIEAVFPKKVYSYESKSHDKIEDRLISGPLEKVMKFLGRFRIFQNGQTQSYLMYGFLFIIIVLVFEFFRK